MYEGCFLQTRLSKTLNASIDQKTRLNICFKTCSRAFDTLSRAFKTLDRVFEGLRENQELSRVFEKLGHVFVLETRPTLSQPATILKS